MWWWLTVGEDKRVTSEVLNADGVVILLLIFTLSPTNLYATNFCATLKYFFQHIQHDINSLQIDFGGILPYNEFGIHF